MKKVMLLSGVCIIGIAAIVAYKRPLFFLNLTKPLQTNATVVYKGTLPCADCPGIDVTLTLYGNGTYDQVYVYRERTGTFEEKGSWTQKKGTPDNQAEVYYELISADGATKTYYLVRGNDLQQLDTSLQRITGPYSGSLTRQ